MYLILLSGNTHLDVCGLYNSLLQLSLVHFNFLLLNFNKCKFSAEQVNRKLQKNGLILRETKIYGIKNSLRITIGNIKENKFFLNKIKIIFKNV